ncbi:MAG TPA: 4-alpha-glucanotransferase, partial [Steroidobacteraceae bacterium]|nr:4-alpha-glucanotransferase [Steroidobacteraceae bacterium]
MATARLPVFDRRRAGVLLHMGSLEGGLGRSGRAFIDWLATAGFSVWQILPVGPTGSDGSPYWVRSDYAGNPAFIDSTEWPDLKSG